MQPDVAIHDVTFAYRETPVLEEVTLSIHSGEFIGIIGPNGGGKSTLLKIIMGFLKPTKGSVEVFGTSPKASRSLFAYVPQAMQYDRQFPISVLELVLSGCLSTMPWYGTYSSKDYEAAHAALHKVGLSGLLQRPFGSLSGGQAQRALIARALVSEPKLLLLDEPTASVDARAEAEIYSILESLREKMTILMVTHDLNAVIKYVDRVICVQRNVISLKPEQVCEHFAFGLYHPPLLRDAFGRKNT